jgi:hypothetical protein
MVDENRACLLRARGDATAQWEDALGINDEGLSRAVVADTTTLRRLGYRALEEGWPSPSDKAFDELDPEGRHVGVLVHVLGWDGKSESAVGPDALGIVTWALALDGRDGRVIVHIGIPVGTIAEMEQAIVNSDDAAALVDAAREYLGQMRFQAQAQGELDRILRGDFGDASN